MDAWVQAGAAEIARRAVRELEALVAVSSPSGDVHGAEECASVCAALLPDEALIERIDCSSPGHAPDLLARLKGTGAKRILLLGHLDTVVAHADHKPLTRQGEKLVGSGSVDMKGGVVLSLGAMRMLARRPQDYAEVALLVVCDEEWRKGPLAHVARFAGWDACLCFEGGERTPDGDDGVVVRRKAAGTIKVIAPRALRALGLGARPRPQRAAGARRGRPRGRRRARPRRPGAPDRGADRAAQRRRVQRRPRPRRALLRPARRRDRRDRGRARGDPRRARAACGWRPS